MQRGDRYVEQPRLSRGAQKVLRQAMRRAAREMRRSHPKHESTPVVTAAKEQPTSNAREAVGEFALVAFVLLVWGTLGAAALFGLVKFVKYLWYL